MGAGQKSQYEAQLTYGKVWRGRKKEHQSNWTLEITKFVTKTLLPKDILYNPCTTCKGFLYSVINYYFCLKTKNQYNEKPNLFIFNSIYSCL